MEESGLANKGEPGPIVPLILEEFQEDYIVVEGDEPVLAKSAEWIDQWLNLFPKGVKSGGYYVRTNRKDTAFRMDKFMQDYPYSKETIFEATKLYIAEQSKNRFSFMMTAANFILKDGRSVLADYCERVSGGEPEGPSEVDTRVHL